MTPDRREELRRCDDASYRTRTSREIDELKERIKALESLLAEIGADEHLSASAIHKIDAILPSTEGKK